MAVRLLGIRRPDGRGLPVARQANCGDGGVKKTGGGGVSRTQGGAGRDKGDAICSARGLDSITPRWGCGQQGCETAEVLG